MTEFPKVHLVLHVLTVVLLFLLVVAVWKYEEAHKSCFENDYGIRQRSDVVFTNTGSDERSLNQRAADAAAQAAAVATGVSKLTGSRDIPVFFQDYDYDMTLSKTGLKNSREGLAGDAEEKKKFTLG